MNRKATLVGTGARRASGVQEAGGTVDFVDIVFNRVRRELQEHADRERIEREIASYARSRRGKSA